MGFALDSGCRNSGIGPTDDGLTEEGEGVIEEEVGEEEEEVVEEEESTEELELEEFEYGYDGTYLRDQHNNVYAYDFELEITDPIGTYDTKTKKINLFAKK